MGSPTTKARGEIYSGTLQTKEIGLRVEGNEAIHGGGQTKTLKTPGKHPGGIDRSREMKTIGLLDRHDDVGHEDSQKSVVGVTGKDLARIYRGTTLQMKGIGLRVERSEASHGNGTKRVVVVIVQTRSRTDAGTQHWTPQMMAICMLLQRRGVGPDDGGVEVI